jgi:hypothetical protein
MNETIQTQVFCSQCDFVTSDFVEFHGEFYCQQQCVAFLPTFESMEEQSASLMALELSTLMDEVEADGYVGSSDDGDARMIRIMELANVLEWLYPEKLDPRFS